MGAQNIGRAAAVVAGLMWVGVGGAVWGQTTGPSTRPAIRAPLADRVPADATVYVGWSGAGGAGFKGSKAERLYGESVAGVWRVAGSVVAAQGKSVLPANEGLGKALVELATAVWERPAVVYKHPGGWALMVDAGPQADEIVAGLTGAPPPRAGAGGGGEAPAQPARRRRQSSGGGGGGGGAPAVQPEGAPFALSYDRDGGVIQVAIGSAVEMVRPPAAASTPPAAGGAAAGGGESRSTRRRRSEPTPAESGGGAEAAKPVNLAGTELFIDAMRRADGGGFVTRPAVVVWADVKVLARPYFRETVAGDQPQGGEQNQSSAGAGGGWTWVNASWDNTGLEEVRYAVLSAGWDAGGDWVSSGFVSVPEAEIKGLVRTVLPAGDRRVTNNLLNRIAGDAAYVETFRFDPNRLLLGFKELYAGDDANEGMTKAMKREEWAKANILTKNPLELVLNHFTWKYLSEQAEALILVRNGIVRGLGPEWAMVSVRDERIAGGSSVVLVNRVRESEQLRENLALAGRTIEDKTLELEGGQYKYTTVQQRGLVVHVVSHEGRGLRICWAVRDGLFVVGDSAEAVSAALTLPARGKGLGDSGRIAAAVKALGAPETAAVSVADAGAMWPGSHARAVAAATALDATGLLGKEKLLALVPLQAKGAELLKGDAMSAGWTDADGYHFRGKSPVPGAEMMAPTEGLMRQLGLAAGDLWRLGVYTWQQEAKEEKK